MKCVYAIGEKLPDREKGLEATMAVCIDQLSQVKSLLDPEKANASYKFRNLCHVNPVVQTHRALWLRNNEQLFRRVGQEI